MSVHSAPFLFLIATAATTVYVLYVKMDISRITPTVAKAVVYLDVKHARETMHAKIANRNITYKEIRVKYAQATVSNAQTPAVANCATINIT
jgi:hypothetical protein